MRIKEACGVFGINRRGGCFEQLQRGAYHLQSRGQRYGGFSVIVDGAIKTEVEPGLIRPTFEDKKMKNPAFLESEMGIAHVSLLDPQPIKAISPNFGPFALALNGRIINKEKVLKELGNPTLFIGSDAEILATLVARGKDCLGGIKKIFQHVQGAFSLAIITPEGVFVARDPFGFKPLILGKSLKSCACSSESPGLTKMGMQIARDVKPGEIDILEKGFFRVLDKIDGPRRALCPFEYTYFARESGTIEGVPIKSARHNTGGALAEDDDVGAHLVSSIPFSGNAHAEGYQLVSGLTPISVFEYYRYSHRSWEPDTQATSDIIADDKLSINESSVRNKSIVIVDDSIFGATQIINWVYRLLDAGALEVHVRIAVPPVRFPCIFDFPNRINKMLLAAKYKEEMIEEEIKKIIGATTLKINNLDAVLNSIISAQVEEVRKKTPLKKEDFCTYCFTGINPFD